VASPLTAGLIDASARLVLRTRYLYDVDPIDSKSIKICVPTCPKVAAVDATQSCTDNITACREAKVCLDQVNVQRSVPICVIQTIQAARSLRPALAEWLARC